MTFVSCPPTVQHCSEPDSVFSRTSSQVLAGSYQVPVKSPVLHVEQAPFPWHLFTWQVVQHPDYPGGPSLTSFWFTNVIILLGYGGHHWMWH